MNYTHALFRGLLLVRGLQDWKMNSVWIQKRPPIQEGAWWVVFGLISCNGSGNRGSELIAVYPTRSAPEGLAWRSSRVRYHKVRLYDWRSWSLRKHWEFAQRKEFLQVPAQRASPSASGRLPTIKSMPQILNCPDPCDLWPCMIKLPQRGSPWLLLVLLVHGRASTTSNESHCSKASSDCSDERWQRGRNSCQ